jgi:hypothetical protein
MEKKTLSKVAVLLVLSLTTLTACNIDDNDGNSSSYIDNVAVVNESGSTYFIGSGGAILIPYPVVTNTGNMKSAFIQFTILSDLSSGTTKKYSIQLIYGPTGIDAKVNRAANAAKLDSIKNDSVINISSGSYINDQFMVLGVNYYINKKYHYLTLCYTDDKGFISSENANKPDTLKFVLHHNANNDTSGSNTSSDYYVYNRKADFYFMSYDIKNIIAEAQAKNGGKKLYVDVEYKACDIVYNKCNIKHIGFNYPLSN